jgi:hypothetical protein
MSDTYSEDDRKPAAIEDREPRDLEKGKGGGGGRVKLPPSATMQSNHAQSSSSRHKRSHKHQHHHHDESLQNNQTTKPLYEYSNEEGYKKEIVEDKIEKSFEPFTYAPSLMGHVYRHDAAATNFRNEIGKD